MCSWDCLPPHCGGSSRFIKGGSRIPPPFSSKRISFSLGQIKYFFPYQRLILPYQILIFREVRNLETRKFVDKYLLCISLLYPFVHNELAISKRTTGWETWNDRRAGLWENTSTFTDGPLDLLSK